MKSQLLANSNDILCHVVAYIQKAIKQFMSCDARENQQFGFRTGPTQTGLYILRRMLES